MDRNFRSPLSETYLLFDNHLDEGLSTLDFVTFYHSVVRPDSDNISSIYIMINKEVLS